MYKTKVTSEEKIKAKEAFLEGTGSQKSCLKGVLEYIIAHFSNG